MTTVDDLDGSFKSLTDTLHNRLSPFFDEAVSAAWLGAIGHAAAIGRDVAAWQALPEDLGDAGDRVVAAIDTAARHLASASTAGDAPILAALAEVEAALGLVDDLLGRTP